MNAIPRALEDVMAWTVFAMRLLAAVVAAICLSQSPAAAQVSARFAETVGVAKQVPGAVRAASLQAGGPVLASASVAERRLALVIGNSNYETVTALPNPANDAKAVAQLLNSAGFEVVMAFDLGRDTLRQVVAEFSARIVESGPNSAALVYYAGHGLQVDGENFLVPVDAKIEKESDVAEQAVRLAEVMQALENAPSRVRIVILDACRNNPFSALRDASGKGLAIVDAPAGSIVAYATAPGTEAFDGAGQHSPYTAAFLRTAKQPGLPIEQLFKRVRVLVADATDAKQMPWESSSLTTDFVFFTGDPNANVAAAPAVEKVAVAQLATRSVEKAYEVVVAEDSVEYYEEFVRIYPTHPLCDRIRRLLALRLQMIAWHKATKVNSPDAYKAFLAKHGNSELAGAAKKLIEKPRLVSLPVAPKIDAGKAPVIGFPKNDNIKIGPVGNGQNGTAGGIKTGPVVKPTGPVIPFPKNGQNGSATGNVPGNVSSNVSGKATTLPNPNGPAGKLPGNGQTTTVPGKATTLPNPNAGKLPGNGQVTTLPKPGEGVVNRNTGVVTKLPANINTAPAIRRTSPNGNSGVSPQIRRLQVQPNLNNNVQVRRNLGAQPQFNAQPQLRQSAGSFRSFR